jgi:hypothetical protein
VQKVEEGREGCYSTAESKPSLTSTNLQVITTVVGSLFLPE